MKLADKVILGLTGLWVVVGATAYLKNRGKEYKENCFCPYCRNSFDATQDEFMLHVSDEVWRRRRRA